MAYILYEAFYEVGVVVWKNNDRWISLAVPYQYGIPYAGKFWRSKILANLAINANSPNFFPDNTYKDTETTEDLPLDLPKFSSPFALTVAIRQNFPMYGKVRLDSETSSETRYIVGPTFFDCSRLPHFHNSSATIPTAAPTATGTRLLKLT